MEIYVSKMRVPAVRKLHLNDWQVKQPKKIKSDQSYRDQRLCARSLLGLTIATSKADFSVPKHRKGRITRVCVLFACFVLFVF